MLIFNSSQILNKQLLGFATGKSVRVWIPEFLKIYLIHNSSLTKKTNAAAAGICRSANCLSINIFIKTVFFGLHSSTSVNRQVFQ